MAEKKRQSTAHSNQEHYVASQKARGQGTGIVFTDAFLRGMRDIGYRDSSWALCEQCDNAIEADATMVAVRFRYAKDNGTRKRPDSLAVVDNGIGMIPEMISYAVRWGGTHREESRKGFGRYGYGLPSSAISFSTRYTVYSRTHGEEWWAVTVDVEQLAEIGGQVEKIEELLQPRQKDPPAWTIAACDSFDVTALESGTIVVHEKLDRLSWKTTSTLESKLCLRLGTVYRHRLPGVQLFVNDTAVKAVDPLFLMEHGVYFSRDDKQRDADGARKIDTRSIVHEYTDVDGNARSGRITVRAALLPPSFPRVDPNTQSAQGKNKHPRHKIMKEHHGLIVCRNGRQVDVVSPKWTKFQNYDMNIKIELDFDAELDGCFGITTSKQQITIENDLWQRLTNAPPGGADLVSLVVEMRSLDAQLRANDAARFTAESNEDTPRASETAMAETAKLKPRRHQPSEEQVALADAELDSAAAKVSETTGMSYEEARRDFEGRAEKRPFEVSFMAMEEGVFYLPKKLGEQRRLIINSLHPFYSKCYSRSSEIRSALEVLLLVLADAELEVAGTEFGDYYKAARHAWSERLAVTLDRLTTDEELQDVASAVSEHLDVAAVLDVQSDAD